MAVICANACTCCTNGSGWVSEEVYDSDTERLVVTDFRCECRGVMCLACQFGAACQVTGEAVTEPAGAAPWWDEGGAEDFERFDD